MAALIFDQIWIMDGHVHRRVQYTQRLFLLVLPLKGFSSEIESSTRTFFLGSPSGLSTVPDTVNLSAAKDIECPISNRTASEHTTRL